MTRQVYPEDVHAGNVVQGEIHVRAGRAEMPASGSQVAFAGYEWLVTRRNVRTEGGRACYVAVLLPDTGGTP